MFYKTFYSQISFLRDLTNSFQLVGLYEDGNWSPGNAYIYVTLIYNLRFWSRRWWQSCRSWWSYEAADLSQYLSDIFDIWLHMQYIWYLIIYLQTYKMTNLFSASQWRCMLSSSSILPQKTFWDRTIQFSSSSLSKVSSSSLTGRLMKLKRFILDEIVHDDHNEYDPGLKFSQWKM